MKQAIALMALLWAGFELGGALLGSGAVLLVAYGAIALIALLIAATFLWLWLERTTPLALGMAFSWLGAGLFAGAWWWRSIAGPALGVLHPHLALGGLALCFVGALFHFSVIHRSFGHHGIGFVWPVLASLAVSAAFCLTI